MAELYGDLPSPDAAPCVTPSGMRSHLYDYQRRSVAAMLRKEACCTPVADPLYIPLVGLDGTTFYLQPGRMEIVSSQPQIESNRGGILCEELGMSLCSPPYLQFKNSVIRYWEDSDDPCINPLNPWRTTRSRRTARLYLSCYDATCLSIFPW